MLHNCPATHKRENKPQSRESTQSCISETEIPEFQEVRDKYHKMMREISVSQQPSEPVSPPVGRPVGIPPPPGIQIPAGINRFNKPPFSSDRGPPASDSGPSEGRRRWGGPPGGPGPDPQDPTGRAPDRNTDSKKSKASNIILPALPSPPGFHLWRSSVGDTIKASYEYDPDAAHTWITAVEKPTATFDLMSMCEPHFVALDAK